MKQKSVIAWLMIMLLSVACENYLDKENYSSIGADNLYATKSGYEGLVNTCYSSLRDIFGEEIWVFCAGTDMYVEGKNSQPEGLSEYRSLSPGDRYVLNFYTNLYKSIQLCNTAIYYNDRTESTNTLGQLLAEARFSL